MANIRSFSRSFAGGELTPQFFGQVADAKFQTGLAVCRNFVVLPHGPVQNRAGFAFVRAVKDSAKRVRLLPFTYSTTQTMVLEFGDGYIRFHTQGATLESSPGVAYEVATPYLQADLFDIHYVQSADVLTLVHPGYAPMELRRLGALNWTLTAIQFATSLQPPTGVTATATPGTSPVGPDIDHVYAVTTVGELAQDESLISASATCSNNLNATGAYNTIDWTAAANAKRYNVYKRSNGLWGYIGQADGLTFKDENITPDVSKTPPEANNPFVGAGNYPGAVSYYEQRRWFAGTLNQPQNIWATRSGTESNLTYSIPTIDSDSISFRVVAREANTVRHLVPLANLMALTSAAEWRFTSINTDAVTPTSISVKPQSYIGANNAQPIVANNNLIYAASRGGHMRELAYSFNANGYVTGDLSLRAPHLFDTLDVVDVAYSKAPQPIVWAVSSNGNLLGLTYVPEQQIGAWHRHDTDGVFESVAAVAEGVEDVLYAVIRRTVNGQQVRYVERQRTRVFDTQADAFFVDSGLTYTGAPATTISGLGHLEGKTVSILGDGSVRPRKTVTAGAITLDQAASVVHIGLPITSDIQTMPLAIEIQGFGQGRVKNINKVFPRVFASSGIFAGPSFDSLTEFKQRTTEPYGSPPSPKTQEIEIVVQPAWQDGAQICLRQSDPLPLTVLSLALEVSVGG
ncbi:hypothetical protein [Comamonas sp. C24C]